MKKILLIIAIALCIFQMVVMATAIDIGNAATDRAGNIHGYTCIDAINSANASGTITSVELWITSETVDVEVAIFYIVSGTNFSTRANVALGTLAAGYHEIAVNLSVETGDYIGVWIADAGGIDRDTSGTGYWILAGDNIPCTDTTFSFGADRTLSLYGTGATAAATDNAIMFGFNF